MLAKKVERFCAEGWLNLIGGCCGTTPEHIARARRGRRAAQAPRAPRDRARARSSRASSTLEIDRRHPPGDRRRAHQRPRQPQVQGADRRREDRGGGRGRPRPGAAAARRCIDVCLQDPDRDELADIDRFLETVVKKVKVPLMIDSTDAKVHRARRSAYARASRSSTRSTSRTARSASSSVVPLARTLRRRAGRRLHRRGQAAGAGGHARAQARRSRSARTTC